MQIIGGIWKGRKLVQPERNDTRPMRHAVRAALFNILSDSIRGCAFLDLFAGSGSVGLEALSRGAQSCVFVDHSAEARASIWHNLESLECDKSRVEVYQADVLAALQRFQQNDRAFDLVFAGPPYGRGLADQTLQWVASNHIARERGIVVTEIFKKETLRERYGMLTCYDRRRYGDNLLIFYSSSELQSAKR